MIMIPSYSHIVFTRLRTFPLIDTINWQNYIISYGEIYKKKKKKSYGFCEKCTCVFYPPVGKKITKPWELRPCIKFKEYLHIPKLDTDTIRRYRHEADILHKPKYFSYYTPKKISQLQLSHSHGTTTQSISNPNSTKREKKNINLSN